MEVINANGPTLAEHASNEIIQMRILANVYFVY